MAAEPTLLPTPAAGEADDAASPRAAALPDALDGAASGSTAAGPEADKKTAANRARADRRRGVQRAVQAAREKLSSASGTRPDFDYELALTFAHNRLSAAIPLPLLTIILAATASLWLGADAVIAWGAMAIAVHVAIVALCRSFVNTRPAAVKVARWTRRFVIAEFIEGLAWASILLFAWHAEGTGIEVFQFAAMLIVVSVVTILAATVPAAVVAGTVPVSLTLAAIYLGRHEFLFVALAIMALGILVVFLMLAGRLFSSTLTTLEYRAEKDLLIAELETAKAISDESRRRAEEANLAKSRFLATMSHELRTPLNAILGFSEVMQNEVLGPMENANYKEYVGDIHQSGRHLLNLINEILDLSRVEAGRYELSEEAVSLPHIAQECVHLLQIRTKAKHVQVVEQFEQGMPKIWADDRAVRQVVLNLLSNAIKFTPSGGQIIVKVGWTAGGGQYVSVRDNGPGIPPEEIPIVLSSFGQGSIAIKSAEQGAGLGLPIVQALMSTHDGTFELKSKLREGTEVIAAFPRSRVMEALPPIPDEQRRAGRWLRAG
jgi:two-component system cell cycle sensor histidine kinase PleC